MEGYSHLPSSVFHQHVTSSLSSRLKNFSAMNSNRRPLSFFLLIFFHNLFNCFAADSISPTQFITDSESITSLNQTFKLGFFSPGNSSYRYVGIWYNTLPGEPAVVWVANRENPLTDSSGVFRIDDTGNLVILSGNTNTVWTTNVSATANNTRAELLESGNLVLRELSFNSSSSGGILWQSFEHPSHTILQDMKFGANTKTGERDVITSWKADSDPTKGRFRLEFEPLNIPQLVLWDGSRRHWRSGPWDGRIFLGVEGMNSDYLNGFSLVRDENEGIVYTIFSYVKKPLFVRYVLKSAGDIAETRFDEGENQWVEDWSAPQTECDFYGKCGSFGVCDLSSKPVCSCLKGYVPDSIQEWNQRNWSRGCIKSTPLQCEQDGFLKHGRMKVPDFVDWVGGTRDLDGCKQKCLVDCSCTAYSYQTGIGCMSWTGNLIDLQKFSTDGVDLYVRVANSELVRQKNLKLITIIITLLGFITICVCIYIFWRWMKKPNGRRKKRAKFLMLGKHNLTHSENLESEIPTFDYEILAVATDYFSLANKLGEGGFGSVYKGKLPSGQEIAVKRLSKSSGQGTEEFKNEVVVISGLQHRNLVRLLGCCIEGEEKMLIYEHMPNKSLDAFLFDPLKRGLLSWRTRFQIIVGIGRGILYLHRDSRLKVIHRDLKPSNILLDKDLNPKISDFGMARIFGVDELQANTIRVVGTYGYMSPEYAMEGVFSEKSDVYSFGVLLLEIITGLRNTGFYHNEESLSLIQHVWKLWNQGETRVLIDSTISEPSSDEEILRHIHVGLLCVQDLAKDRPNMSSVISMLTSEILSLPTPKQAAFTWRQGSSDYDSSNCGHKNGSINNVSITTIGGR